MKNTLGGINHRITEVEEQINDMQDRLVEITFGEQVKKKQRKINEEGSRDLCNNNKHRNIRIIGLPKDKEIASPGAWSAPTQPGELNYKLDTC